MVFDSAAQQRPLPYNIETVSCEAMGNSLWAVRLSAARLAPSRLFVASAFAYVFIFSASTAVQSTFAIYLSTVPPPPV